MLSDRQVGALGGPFSPSKSRGPVKPGLLLPAHVNPGVAQFLFLVVVRGAIRAREDQCQPGLQLPQALGQVVHVELKGAHSLHVRVAAASKDLHPVGADEVDRGSAVFAGAERDLVGTAAKESYVNPPHFVGADPRCRALYLELDAAEEPIELRLALFPVRVGWVWEKHGF